MVHRMTCPDIGTHVSRALTEAWELPEHLDEFVEKARAEFEAERQLLEQGPPVADRYAPRRDWTESELRFAAGDR